MPPSPGRAASATRSREDFGIHPQLPYPPAYELGVLTAEIEDDYFIHGLSRTMV